MVRRRHDSEGSLEFLLDTITNAFGGVLFLAILLSIQLQNREVSTPDSRTSSTSRELELTKLRMRLQELSYERTSLRDAIKRQEQTQREFRARGDDSALERLTQTETERISLETQRADLEKQVHEAAAAVRDISTGQAELQDGTAARRRELSAIEAELVSEIESRTIEGRLPKTHLSWKKEFAIVLRYGRAYRLRTGKGKLNGDDFLVASEKQDTLVLEPKPYRGIPIQDSDTFPIRLRALLHGLQPTREYIAVAAWYDSFDEFRYIKRELVKLGFAYRLIPVEKGGEVNSGFATPWVQ